MENEEYPFIAPRSILALSGKNWLGPFYRSDRRVWHLNYMQTNDLCQNDLLETEPLDNLTVCKQMTDV